MSFEQSDKRMEKGAERHAGGFGEGGRGDEANDYFLGEREI
jgi:hypothetical protein